MSDARHPWHDGGAVGTATHPSNVAARILWFVLAALLLLGCGVAQAHKGSDAYLDVRELPVQPAAEQKSSQPADGLHGYRFGMAVALRDLDQVVAVDADGDGRITWGEVHAASPSMVQAVQQAVQLEADDGKQQDACALRWQVDGFERRSDGLYLRLTSAARCSQTQALKLKYTLFGAQDANHRLLVTGHVGGADLLLTASPQDNAAVYLGQGQRDADGANGHAAARRWATLSDYFLLGMHHLLQGYDHLAFLLALLLPLQLRLRSGRTRVAATEAFGSSRTATVGAGIGWAGLLRTVTAFTIGHSITLVLASLRWTEASPTWVEPAIALSIGVTALLNLYPVRWLRIELLALGFGMIHGYGFAGLMLEAGAPDGLLPWALAGFNLGVEGGQLIAVATWITVAQGLMRYRWYKPVVVRGGSVMLAALSLVWFWQRVA
ncbi:MAG: HupE/UreJ family protein [Burkholderiaceae bacterium]